MATCLHWAAAMILSTLLSLSLATTPPALSPTAEPSLSSVPTSARLLAEGVGGTVGMIGGGFAGFAVAAGIGCLTPSGGAGDFCALTGVLGILPGAALGTSLGVHLGGAFTKGQGSYWGTLIGATAGAGVGLAAIYVTAIATGSNATPMMIATAAAAGLVLTGGVVGYELGHRARTAPPRTRMTVIPVVTPGGGVLSLAGTF